MQPTPKTSALSAERRAEFSRIVARFEEAWFAEQRPQIETFLRGDDELRPVLLAELMRIDCEFRAKAGETVLVDDYLVRFPDLAHDANLINSLAGGIAQVGGAATGLEVKASNAQPQTTEAVRPDLRQSLIASRLVTEQQFQQCEEAVAKENGAVTAGDLIAELLRRGWVTRWQLEQLGRGQTGFFIDQGRYLLLSLIGQGGMGAVYKARHVRMGRDVALKVIAARRVTDRGLVDRFRREVEVCSKLQHEHIVQAHDVGIHAGALFLVLEFVDGSDLASLVKRDGPMQPDEAAAIVM